MTNSNTGGDLQQGVAGSLGWASGEAPFFDSSSPLRRMLSGNATSATHNAVLPELITLTNLLVTCVIGILMTFAIHLVLVLIWKNLINRRYYLQQAALKEASEARTPDAAELKRLAEWDVGKERFCFGLFGPRRKLKPPKFMPWPKSLVWPSPLFFTSCIFITGITRASVRLIAVCSLMEDYWLPNLVVPIAVLTCLVGFILVVIADLVAFRMRHAKQIKWKPAERCDDPSKVGDPYMRLNAKMRMQAAAGGAAFKHRSMASLRRLSGVKPTRVHPDRGEDGTRPPPSVPAPLVPTPMICALSASACPAPLVAQDAGFRKPMRVERPLARNDSTASLLLDTRLNGADRIVDYRRPMPQPMRVVTRTHSHAQRAYMAYDTALPPPEPLPSPPPLSTQDEIANGSCRRSVSFSNSPTVAMSTSERRRANLKEASSKAIARLAGIGFRDRKSGTWTTIEEDLKEPERTERLLAAPFALRKSRAGDTWQTFEGFFVFRVNGGNSFSCYYRLVVIGVNMLFGIISGLQPLLPVGSFVALLQSFFILALQLGMSLLCFCCLPDADRIISRFAGSQFLFEGFATTALLVGDLHLRSVNGCTLRCFLSVDADVAAGVQQDAVSITMQNSGFLLSLIAMGVPVVQLLEQRLLTPVIGIFKTRAANPLALCAAVYMLAASLPRQIDRLLSAIMGGAVDSAQAAQSASADAGDEAVVEDGGGGDGGGGDGQTEANGGSSVEAGVSAEAMGDAATRVTRLLARAVAAKEVSSKNMAPYPTIPLEAESEGGAAAAGGHITTMAAAARLRAYANRRRDHVVDDDDDDDDDDDGGGDDID